jgi:hypothetical protein
VVVVTTDDLDERSLDRMVANGLMPKLKRHLLDRGTRFVNSFVTPTLCCPSRATFFTGQYTIHPREQFSAVRTTQLSLSARHKFYVEWDDDTDSREFYDLLTDPHQLMSQHANPTWASVRASLEGWLAQLRTCGNGTCQTLEDQ